MSIATDAQNLIAAAKTEQAANAQNMPTSVTSSKEARVIDRDVFLSNLIRDLAHFVEAWEWNRHDEINNVENMKGYP